MYDLGTLTTWLYSFIHQSYFLRMYDNRWLMPTAYKALTFYVWTHVSDWSLFLQIRNWTYLTFKNL